MGAIAGAAIAAAIGATLLIGITPLSNAVKERLKTPAQIEKDEDEYKQEKANAQEFKDKGAVKYTNDYLFGASTQAEQARDNSRNEFLQEQGALRTFAADVRYYLYGSKDTNKYIFGSKSPTPDIKQSYDDYIAEAGIYTRQTKRGGRT